MLKLAPEEIGVGDRDVGVARMVMDGSYEFHESRDFG